MASLIAAADHAGVQLKDALVAHLREQGHDVEDLGTHGTESVDYPDFAHRVAERIAGSEGQLGLLVCGSGIGMAMSANRHPGVRAVVCSEPYSARMSREHNDANVLCVGQRVVGVGLAIAIVEAFMAAEFTGGRHVRRVAKIDV
ncbi:MAG: ribose 5-phosphate isomerase B [Sandaracinaceae bacterium]